MNMIPQVIWLEDTWSLPKFKTILYTEAKKRGMNSGASGCLFTTDHVECFIKDIFIRHKRLKYRTSWAGKRRHDNNLDYYVSDL